MELKFFCIQTDQVTQLVCYPQVDCFWGKIAINNELVFVFLCSQLISYPLLLKLCFPLYINIYYKMFKFEHFFRI